MSRRELCQLGVVFAVAAIAVALRAASVSGQIVFVVAAIALAALAWALAQATDQAGESAGPRASALLNATFGNLPEVVIVVLAIRAGLDDIARASIIGSVIGNVLLILGLSLVVGGWKNGTQTFTEKVAATNSSMLVLGVAGLGIPTLFAALEHDHNAAELLSRWTGGALVVVYAAYLYYSFHMPALRDQGQAGGTRWTRRQALVALALTALGTGVVSEVLVDSIRPAVDALGVPRPFVGLVVVPFVGNVAEHFSAVRSEPGRLRDGHRIRLGHPDRAGGIGGRGARGRDHGQRPHARVRPAPAGGARHGGPRLDTDRTRRRDQLARGTAAAHRLSGRVRRRLVAMNRGFFPPDSHLNFKVDQRIGYHLPCTAGSTWAVTNAGVIVVPG